MEALFGAVGFATLFGLFVILPGRLHRVPQTGAESTQDSA
jgi:hypothetical protein